VTQAGGVYVVMAMRPIRALAVLMLVVTALNGCVAGPAPGAKGIGVASGSPSLTTSPATPTSTDSPTANTGSSPHVLSACQLTKPMHPFVPPAAYDAPVRPPLYYDAEWYGTARLWTMLRRGGEVWSNLPRGADGFGQKTFWWSADFDVNHEPQPAISVTGRQLDGSGRFATPAPGTNAGADFGSAMLIGVGVPTIGCWEITATYRHATLLYVTWVGG
jgi:hypothetical protein